MSTPAQIITAPAQPPATEVVVYTALFYFSARLDLSAMCPFLIGNPSFDDLLLWEKLLTHFLVQIPSRNIQKKRTTLVIRAGFCCPFFHASLTLFPDELVANRLNTA